MDRTEKTRWKVTIMEKCEDRTEKAHIIEGRTISPLDMKTVFRKAGIQATDQAFGIILTQYNEVLTEVLLARCVTSHKIGYGPHCQFSPSNFTQEELDSMIGPILRPFKHTLAKAALEYGKGVIAEALSPEELQDLKDQGYFTPEEDAAIEAELFLAAEHREKDSKDSKGSEPTSP